MLRTRMRLLSPRTPGTSVHCPRDALQQRIPNVSRLLEHAPIEFQPLHVAVEVLARIVERQSFHKHVLGDYKT